MKNSIIKSAVIASVIALAVSGFAGCTKKPGQANNNAVVGITQEPGIFDPHTVVAAGDEEIIFNVYEGLYKYDSKGDLNPCLATDVAISDDAFPAGIILWVVQLACRFFFSRSLMA